MDRWAAVGLGLDHGAIGLSRTTEAWIVAGAQLCQRVTEMLDVEARIEQIGSSSVLGLLAKPVVDLAVGLTSMEDVGRVTEALAANGWIYRGDAGRAGGHVFVLEIRPAHRVAHAHVVERDGQQWSNYLRFRDLLRASSQACRAYEAVKLQLAEQHTHNRDGAYTEGKTAVVTSLLADAD